MYHILGLPDLATEKEIKKAYRRLVKLYHPDKNKEANAEKKFIEITKAYDYLLDLKSGKIPRPYATVSPEEYKRRKEEQRRRQQEKKRREEKRKVIKEDYKYEKGRFDRYELRWIMLFFFINLFVSTSLGVMVTSWRGEYINDNKNLAIGGGVFALFILLNYISIKRILVYFKPRKKEIYEQYIENMRAV